MDEFRKDIFQSTKTVLEGLEALKEANEKKKLELLSNTGTLSPEESQLLGEKTQVIDKNLESIELAIKETKVFADMTDNVSALEAEKQKDKVQIKRLCHENALIRVELASAQDDLISAQQRIKQLVQDLAQMDEENEHFKFMERLKKSVEGVEHEKENTAVGSEDISEFFFVEEDDGHDDDERDPSIQNKGGTSQIESDEEIEIPVKRQVEPHLSMKSRLLAVEVSMHSAGGGIDWLDVHANLLKRGDKCWANKTVKQVKYAFEVTLKRFHPITHQRSMNGIYHLKEISAAPAGASHFDTVNKTNHETEQLKLEILRQKKHAIELDSHMKEIKLRTLAEKLTRRGVELPAYLSGYAPLYRDEEVLERGVDQGREPSKYERRDGGAGSTTPQQSH